MLEKWRDFRIQRIVLSLVRLNPLFLAPLPPGAFL
jgi:hypothetical protein